MSARLLVIGAVNADVVVAANRLPTPGETVVGPEAQRHGGGKGANAAVASARAGAEVRFCGAVGADDAGRWALAELRGEGIDVTDVAVLDEVSTGVALIVVDPAGENQIAVGAGANAGVPGATVRAAVARAAGWTDCVLVSSEISPVAVAAALRSATEHGMRCVLNPAPVSPAVVELLPEVSVLTPNATELADLYAGLIGTCAGHSQVTVAEMALAVASCVETLVVVTLGGDGVLAAGPDGSITVVPAPDVGEVRDTTGAGDTFNGVFASALAGGASLVPAAVRGVTAASMSVGSVGARAGMPRGADIDAALAVGI